MDEFYLPEDRRRTLSENHEAGANVSDDLPYEFLKSVFEHIPAFIHVRDQRSGKIVWCNDAWENYFHIPKKEVVTRTSDVFKKIIHPDDLYLMKASNEHYLTAGVNNFGGVIRVRYPNAEGWRWLMGISRVIKKDGHGLPLLTLAIFMDFSEVIHTQTQIHLALKDVLHLQYKEILNKVTKRERQVIELVAKGLNNEEIAKALFISHHTVESHRKNIRMKLQIKNTSELISYLKEIGI